MYFCYFPGNQVVSAHLTVLCVAQTVLEASWWDRTHSAQQAEQKKKEAT